MLSRNRISNIISHAIIILCKRKRERSEKENLYKYIISDCSNRSKKRIKKVSLYSNLRTNIY